MAPPKSRDSEQIDGDDTPDDGNGFSLEEVLRLGGTKVSGAHRPPLGGREGGRRVPRASTCRRQAALQQVGSIQGPS